MKGIKIDSHFYCITEHNLMADHNPPSRGERNAIIGYKPQYEIAAIKIIHTIRLGNLESIRIADPEAGRVDDFQILTPNRIDAFQVKWSEHSSLVTYNDLISTDSKGNPSLLSQLADGWKRIRSNNPGKRVVVHLIMRDHPSPNTTKAIPVGDKIPNQYHFAGFISHIWNKAHASLPGEVYQIPLEWEPAWDRFRESSGLTTVDEFNDFVKDCELEFGYEIPTFEELPTNDRNLLIEEKNYISSKLIEIVADSGSSVEYTLKEFLEYLGWTERNHLVNIHDFPVNERTYQQIEGLNEEFEQLISTTGKGYISIIGTPGSGKSTFLTQTLKNRNERVIKYYSFIPDSFEPVNLRGEAKNFLHDIIFQLDRLGFSSGGSISSYDRNILQKRFHNQLQLLHTAWEKDHRKTIFLIDGLDHIAREQHPEFSLLNDLPNPTTIPDGIIFVLGSQTDEIFLSAIKSEVRNGRRIEMRPLSRQAVLEIVNATNFKTVPTSDQISRIYTLSDGHPLALNYILNRIHDAQTTEDINTILSSTQQYSGNIEQQYQSYWDEVSVNSQLFELFGLIARCKSDIDISWFEGWYSQKAIYNLKKSFSHYFKRYDQHAWSFFHNSFRIFVLQKTCDSGQGVIDPLKSIHYHQILVEQSIRQPDNLIHTWDEFFHRYNAKQYQEIIGLATPEYFRNQFLNYRSIPDIKNDINIALGCAKELQNFVILSRLLLIGTEYELRQNYLDDISYIPLLFRLYKDQRKLCLNHILFGNVLQISQNKALLLSKNIVNIVKDDARQIFDLAEPVDILIAKELIQDPRRFEPELLHTWAASVPYFRTSSEIIDLIKRCQQKNPHLAHKSLKEGREEYQKELLYRAAISYIDLECWNDVKVITEEICRYPHYPLESDEFNLYYWCWERCERLDDAHYFLENGKRIVGDSYLSPKTPEFNSRRIILLATGIFNIESNLPLVKQYLQNLSLKNVDLKFDTSGFSNPELIFFEFFKYLKLKFYLGDEYQPVEDIPEIGNVNDNLQIEFKRNVYTLAYISAMGDLNKTLNDSQIETFLSPILKLYNKEFRVFHNSTNGSLIQRAREEFFKFLVYSVLKHGDPAIRILYKLLDEEWNTANNKRYWSSKTWENFIFILYNRGYDKKWSINKITALETSILLRPNEYYDTYQRVHEYFDYAKTWYQVNDNRKSDQFLKKAIQTSFGIGFRKDYQLNSWIKWLEIINRIEPEKRIERTAYFVKIISVMHEYVEKRADLYAAEDLVSITFPWSPKRALILTRWFIDREIFSETFGRELYLSELLQSDCSLDIDDVIPFVDIMLLGTEEIESVHKQIIERIIVKSKNTGEKYCIKIIKHLIESVSQNGNWSPISQWQLIIAENIEKNGFNSTRFGLDINELKELVNSKKSSTYDYDDKIPQELLQRPVTPALLIQNLPAIKYRRNWEPLVIDVISEYSKEQVQELLEGISNNSDICIILSRKLMELSDVNGAKQAAIKAIKECEWGGYGLPSDYGVKVEGIKILLEIDRDLAKKIAFDVIFEDLTVKYPYFSTIATQMHTFIPEIIDECDEIKKVWKEIQEYLDQILSEYTLPPDLPEKLLSDTSDDTVISAFEEFQKIF